MAWTNLTFPFGSVLTSSKMTQLDDNLDALANGDAGAPSIQTAALAANAVTAAKIATGAVGASEIATGAVGASEIAANAVGQSEIASGAVARTHLDTLTGSTAGSINSGEVIGIILNSYSFFPMCHAGSKFVSMAGHVTDGASADNSRFALYNSGGTSTLYDVDHRYIAS